MLSNLLRRNARRNLLIEFNPYQVLVAELSYHDRGPTVVTSAAEFDKADDAGLRRWLEANSINQKSWISAICGHVPANGFLQRETVHPRKLSDGDYLANLAREEHKIVDSDEWTFRAVSAQDGTLLPSENTARPALICGIRNSELRGVQQRLFEHNLKPLRIEPSLLPLFGALFVYMARQGDKRSAVVVVIEEEQTNAFILGKEGVHACSPIRHGFRAILQTARKELGLPEDADVGDHLQARSEGTRFRAPMYMRALGRSLKSLVDSYEMSSGQPAGGIYCAYLPAKLNWIVEPLARSMERPPIAIDCNEWLPAAGLKAGPDVASLGSHWLGALSLVARFPDPKHDTASQDDESGLGPWHVACDRVIETPTNQLVGSRFMTGTIAAVFAAFALIVTGWQVYVSNSLQADTAYWEAEMAKNQSLFDELTRVTRDLDAGSARLDQAYSLMASPLQVSDFVLNLGRTLPANMRIDRIETSQGRIALVGALREPSEIVEGTLSRYREELRRAPAIGPLFSDIRLTALQREDDAESLAFEITFRLKSLQP